MAAKGVKALLAEANAVIETIDVEDALAQLEAPDVQFVDIRETQERQASGGVPDSVHAPRGLLEFQADPESPLHQAALSSGKKLILYCASGGRSALAAKTLRDMGIDNICHMRGGIGAWLKAGGPVKHDA